MVKAKIVTPKVSGEFPLVRVRNPWGDEMEWNGAWSDGSPEWAFIPDKEKERLGINFEEDGEFWMSYRDWQSNFDVLEITNLTPDALGDDNPFKWEVRTYTGSWQNTISEMADCPQFLVRLTDPDEADSEDKCTLLVSLLQKGRRSMTHKGVSLLRVGFFIYSLDQEEPGRCSADFFRRNEPCCQQYSHFSYIQREVSGRFKLLPGNYLIVPFRPPRQQGDFMLRVFTEQAVNSTEL